MPGPPRDLARERRYLASRGSGATQAQAAADVGRSPAWGHLVDARASNTRTSTRPVPSVPLTPADVSTPGVLALRYAHQLIRAARRALDRGDQAAAARAIDAAAARLRVLGG